MNDNDRLDLSSLDPTGNRRRFDRVIGALMTAASPELLRRKGPLSVLGQIVWWERPMLVAAALLGLAAFSTLALMEENNNPSGTESVWTTSIGAPAQLSRWLERGETPSVEMALGLGEEGP